MIEKIEKTVDILIPFLILALSALQLTGVIKIIETAQPIIIGGLAAVSAIFKVWGIQIRAKAAKAKA